MTRELRLMLLVGAGFVVAVVLLSEVGIEPLPFVPLPIFIISAWGMLDAAIHRDSVWRAIDQNKVAWVLVQLLPLVGTLTYLIVVHRTLLNEEDRTRA